MLCVFCAVYRCARCFGKWPFSQVGVVCTEVPLALLEKNMSGRLLNCPNIKIDAVARICCKPGLHIDTPRGVDHFRFILQSTVSQQRQRAEP